jgi:hypothetical protein
VSCARACEEIPNANPIASIDAAQRIGKRARPITCLAIVESVLVSSLSCIVPTHILIFCRASLG